MWWTEEYLCPPCKDIVQIRKNEAHERLREALKDKESITITEVTDEQAERLRRVLEERYKGPAQHTPILEAKPNHRVERAQREEEEYRRRQNNNDDVLMNTVATVALVSMLENPAPPANSGSSGPAPNMFEGGNAGGGGAGEDFGGGEVGGTE
jgi:HSP90 family molecular chaperone